MKYCFVGIYYNKIFISKEFCFAIVEIIHVTDYAKNNNLFIEINYWSEIKVVKIKVN